VTWTLEQANAWPGRAQFAAAVYDNKIWVTGGWDGTRRNDVWYSSDGISWTQAAVPAWAGRNGHYNMVHDSKLWVVAGLTATSGRVNDAWWTTDGVTWTSATLAAAFPGQSHGAGTAFDNKLWISGGLTNNNAVWSSIDGTTWTAATLSAQWGARSAHAMAAYNNRLWVMGGSIGDCWASIDGVTWTSEPVPTGWGVRQYPATVVYDNKLWLFGGQVGSTNLNDVWSYSESTPPQVTSTAPTSVVVGNAYSYDIVATGVPAPALSVSGNPAWLTLNGTTLSGTPGPGDLGMTAPITITATNPAGTDAEVFQIDVQGIPPLITSTPLTSITVGQMYSYVLAGSGTPAPTFSAGALPSWLSFNPTTGELSGTATTPDRGLSAQITMTATNGWPPDDTQTFQIQVNGIAPQITSTAPTTATVGQVYTYNIVGTGDPLPSFSVAGNPTWLTLTGSVLSGTPPGAAVGQTGLITVTAANGWAPDDAESFQITVAGIPPTFTSAPVTTATPGTPYLYTATVDGTPSPTMSLGSVLPTWLTFNAATGELSGTPGNSQAKTSVTVTLSATNSVAPDATQTFTIEVERSPDATKSTSEGGGCTGAPSAPIAWMFALAALVGVGVARSVWRARA
jgi:hypothetical protein